MADKVKSKKPRVHELAKELGFESTRTVLLELERFGVKGKTASSSIDEEVAEKVRVSLRAKGKAAPAKPDLAAKPVKQDAKTPSAPPADLRPAEQKEPKPEKKAKAEKAAKPGKPAKKPHLEGISPEGTALPVSEEEPAGAEAAPQPQPAKPEEMLPEEETVLKLPDRFKKEIEAERIEKFKAKPGMQRAFQAIRKVEPRRWADQKGGGAVRHGRGGHAPAARNAPRTEKAAMPQITAPRKKILKLPEGATVKEFAELIGVKVSEIIKKFMEMGYMPTINQPVDTDAAMLVADTFGARLELASAEEETAPEEEVVKTEDENLRPRPPVVTIMGHVDHGKTTLLDAIRESRITEGEAGGITQHIGAYKVKLKEREIVFLDTPGHEAFTTLRARGARITDIVVLVVAADDGVKPQTVEAINHARAANVPIIVAINKMDKPEANPQKVRNELAELGILPEEWGGQNIFVEISAKKRTGIGGLLEMILLQADMLELKADPDKAAKGVIIEARLDKGKGPVATLLVQSGKINSGDAFLCGINAGRVRAMNDETGHRIEKAGPSTPIEVIGFSSLPNAGDTFVVMEDERKARQIAFSRLQKQKQVEVAHAKKLTLDELYSKIKEGEVKDLNIVIKGDAQGSIEAMKSAFEAVTHPEVKVRVIHASIGGINESDVMLAAASNAIIVGFNVRPETKAQQIAEKEGVDLRLYNIIYEAVDDVRKALEGMLEPTIKEKVLGRAEVRQLFHVSRLGTVAGCHVINGMISRSSDGVRVIRDNIVVYEGKISSLKRFKEDVKEVQAGYECGIMIENFNDVKTGDVLENFVMEKIASKL